MIAIPRPANDLARSGSRRHAPPIEAGARESRPTPSSEVEFVLAGLVEKVAADLDRHAFIGLFNHFAPRIKAYLMHQGLAGSLAEARALDAMVALWRTAPGFDRARGSASTWVFRLVRNSCDDRLTRDREGYSG